MHETLTQEIKKPKETNIPSMIKIEEVKKELARLVNETYQEVAREYPEDFPGGGKEIYWQNACQQFSEILKIKLRKIGVQSEFVRKNIKTINPKSKHHLFLSVLGFYVDGTWQQFLEKPNNDNQFLLLDKDNIIEDLKKAKVPKNLWFLYV